MENHKPTKPQYDAYTDKEGKEEGRGVRWQAALTDIYYTRTHVTPYTDYLFQLLPCGFSLPTSPLVIPLASNDFSGHLEQRSMTPGSAPFCNIE